MRAPSMTLSESQAMEDFDFLGSEDNVLLTRFSKASFADIPEGEWLTRYILLSHETISKYCRVRRWIFLD